MALKNWMKIRERFPLFSKKCIFIFTIPGQYKVSIPLPKNVADPTSDSWHHRAISPVLLNKQATLRALSVFHPPPVC